ncbi:hypothetical protein [Helicobacter mesocricetorum]|uniref:hypothetical protein n=1 Tax=Helicobacter mesocricetorum TaxID=87012 RepID=UPI000CF147E5|nr:hypothetical protein [Helicobacter mesocricetorum]
MSQEIERFIEKLKSLSQKDIKPYPFESYNCELAFTQECAFKGDFLNRKLVEMWKDIYNRPYFELHHPTQNHILTRAIQSWQPPNRSLRSLTLFIDENNQFPWVLVVTYEQATSMIIMEDFFLNRRYLSDSQHDIWLRWRITRDCLEMAKEKNLSVENVYHKDTSYCLNIQSERPHHYFTDSLFWFDYLSLKNKIWDTPLFFRSKTMEISKNTREIPVPLHLGYHKEKLDFVAKESLQDFNSLVAPQDKLDRFDKEEVSESEIMELIPQLEA